ncbi:MULTISPECIES: hypothetical protein [Acinetobacter]|uniref:Amino acid transport protein n=1 Tax=Acinetobacter piscicola TaxID=2006115 RepID=A0A4Q4H1A1_9GAMM|nr:MULTISPECIES: hypothetical protein [Acinetobacter]MDM1756196.1 hypothetical protein [Acinetobacter sp. 256-1]MDM1759335.1 hypothetical protein [Acinetobacter sp. 251-1]QOW45295.1 hypothetical protein G0028_04960 [Acinetobacter piscicola]RYL28653.1 hypothetical protein EWP19_04780 [Acinetobacter piscicola]
MNVSALLLGTLFGSIGLGYFIYGKKQHHTIALICGLALMIYPYFFENTTSLIVIGILLMALPKWVKI